MQEPSQAGVQEWIRIAAGERIHTVVKPLWTIRDAAVVCIRSFPAISHAPGRGLIASATLEYVPPLQSRGVRWAKCRRIQLHYYLSQVGHLAPLGRPPL